MAKEVRKYNQDDVLKLIVKAAGRCTLCNKDLLHDYMTKQDIIIWEKAHIRPFSEIGPRASECTVCDEEKNSYDNLLLACPGCHSKIDKEIGAKLYTVDWLKKIKNKKEMRIRKALDLLNNEDHLFIKYSSAINKNIIPINDSEIIKSAFEMGVYSTEDICNITENNDAEDDIQSSISKIDKYFTNRIEPKLQSNIQPSICMFCIAPQYLLMYLGTKFNNKLNIKTFTRHRDTGWHFSQNKENIVEFEIVKPKETICKKSVALKLVTTSDIDDSRVVSSIGDCDIWEVRANVQNIDLIKDEQELHNFMKNCNSALDEIGNIYGKDKIINIFPALPNSLAFMFGRSIMNKAHNPLTIFDQQGGVFVDKLKI